MAGITSIGVTGSNGKSTTVKLLDHILSGELVGVCGLGSNQDDAVARMLSRVRKDSDYVLLEVSAERPGSLDERLALLRPKLAIVMTVGLDHVKAFRTREAVAAEKAKLVAALPADGAAILNADDPFVAAMAEQTQARVVTFGLAEGADFRAVDVNCTWPGRLGFTVQTGGQSLRIETGLLGKHFVTSALAAIAAAMEMGLSLEACAERLAGVKPFYQRMSVHRHPTGAWFIADTYKAPAWSLRASFAVLEGAQAPRKTVILGGISDITGDDSGAHRKAGRAALEFADRVVFWGEKASRARKLKNGPEADRVTLLDTFDDLMEWFDLNLIEDEVVLLKSNRKNHLERAFLVPHFGAFCSLDSCNRAASCIGCPKTAGIEGLREAASAGT